jgi:aldose 1-epimerase
MSQVVEITHQPSATAARVLVSSGFNLFSWTVADGAARRDLIYAEANFSEGDCRPTSGGNPLMFPFAGRIAKGQFTWQGKQYNLPEGDGRGNALHGFAFNRPWRLVEQSDDAVSAEFHLGRDGADALALWPSDFSIRASYRVGDCALDCRVEFANIGDKPLPCCFGWHPYFRLPLSDQGSTAETTLTVPTTQTLPLVDMIPTGKLAPLASGVDLQNGFALGTQAFDEPFLLQPAAGNQHVVTLRDNATGRMVRQTFDASLKYAVVYTPGHRQAVCVEPQTGPPDIFNAQQAGLPDPMLVLEPEGHASYAMRLEWIAGE